MIRNLRQKLGLGLMLAAFVCAFILNLPTNGGRTVSFSSVYGETFSGEPREVTLQGTWWETEGAEYAVLICPGYSCDRQKWRPMADLLVSNGLSVMSFDYSGQGASGGTIGFDNAKTDRIPVQIDDAIEKLHELSGLDYDHIILLGHSMGGRSILRLLYDYNDPSAETTVTAKNIRNVILMAPEVNYNYNAQASLFAGTSDDTQEPWHSYNADCIGTTNVWLFGSVQDDIVSDRDILAIYEHLGGTDVPESGCWQAVQTNENGAQLTVGIVSGILHSYEMYSPEFASMINDAVASITGTAASYPAWEFLLVYAAWFLGLAGVSLFLNGLIAASKEKELSEKASEKSSEKVSPETVPAQKTDSDHLKKTEKTGEDPDEEVSPAGPVLINAGAFLRRKLLLWLPGTAAAFLICCLCVCMPFGSPVMNTPYMCFIAGYGFVMLFFYRKGTFKGTAGLLPPILGTEKGTRKRGKQQEDPRLRKEKRSRILECVLVTAGICLFVWYILRSSMYRLIPLNARLFWVCFAALLMTVSYYVSDAESDMLTRAGASRKVRFLYDLIQYIPLMLLVLFYAVLKSYSGMIGQIQNMLLMYLLCIPLGRYVIIKSRVFLAGALLTGFLLQTVMITSAALIAMF